MCAACRGRWVSLGRPDLAQFASSPLPVNRRERRGVEVDLSGLSERLRLEFLYACQMTWLDGDFAWRSGRALQSVIDAVTRSGIESLLDSPSVRVRDFLYRRLRAAVERFFAEPDRELERDVWRMGVLRPDGGGKLIDYRVISQPWLRELVKQWDRQRLVSHSASALRSSVTSAAKVSEVLRLRPDRGEDPSALGRQDVVDVLTHLNARRLAGEISAKTQHASVTLLRAMLREARDRGLQLQPGPLEGLADEFALYDGDVPRRPRRDPDGEPERALPQVVIDQLLSAQAIALLHEAAGEAAAYAIELQMRTGRRPQEIAHASFNCLEHEQRVREDGKVEYLPVFVYGPERFPDARADQLPLFPRQTGRRAEREAAEGQAPIASLRAELLNLRAQLKRKDAQLTVLERKLSLHAGHELEAALPRPPASLLEQAERASQRALELEGHIGELQAQLDEREQEILALRDSLRKTIRERNTGT